MTTIYIVNKENNTEYNIGTNLIGAIKQMVADQRDMAADEIEIVLTDTEDTTAKAEKRLLNMTQMKQAAHVYGLENEITETPVTVETTENPVTVETPKEEPENPKEENDMTTTTKMPKELGKIIRVAVSEIIAKYTQPLTELKCAYETARDTLKKVRETETDAVKTAKETFDSTEKGTVARKIAGLDLKAARDHKKVAVGEAKLEYDTAKLEYDKTVASMNNAVAEVTRGLINGYQPVVAVLDGSAEDTPAEEPAKEEPVKEEPAAEKPAKEIVEEEVGNTDFGTDDKTGDDKPATDAPAPLPVKTFAVLSFGNVGNKVEEFRAKILASTKYAWKEVQDWKQADLIRVYTQEGAKITSKERTALAAILQADKAEPGRVHFGRVNA